ncbi:hypothetical protein C0Q70_09859 [Pomacea canaliculata]|uniref:Aldehyde dehydrogenase domain-containing protein n=1 Tax=Pomacea canaliculata TaxID=400727 RepID=A0A2T7PAZ8_POMCA|nr:hypothetical protein C0Q70_09859 [Pomacea canaliculata]
MIFIESSWIPFQHRDLTKGRRFLTPVCSPRNVDWSHQRCLHYKEEISVVVRHQRASSLSIVTKDAEQVQKPLNYIGGRRVDPSASSPEFDLVAPATGEILRHVNNSESNDVDAAVDTAKGAFAKWSKVTAFERGKILIKAASIIREHSEVLARTEVLDTGKPIWEARCDILGCADTVEYYGGLASSLAGEFTQFQEGSFAYTIREPVGVIGAVGAWNYPFQMATWKSSPALACGNTVVFKPSPLTPLTAVMLGEIYKQAGLPDGCYNVVQGETVTGQLICRHSDIAKLSFTGSISTGIKGIKYVTLELGGKSPLVIFEDAHMDNAVKGAMLANFSNQGQVCSNGTRVFVQRNILKEFTKRLTERTRAMVIGDPNNEETTVGATISAHQAETVLRYIEGAKNEGACVVYGGERVVPSPHLAGGYYLSPCILGDCRDDMTVVREEVFGSVMSLLCFDTEDEVIIRANNTKIWACWRYFHQKLRSFISEKGLEVLYSRLDVQAFSLVKYFGAIGDLGVVWTSDIY